MTQTLSPEALQTEIQQEIAAHPILVYGKGTAEAPRCGFTLETKTFFENLGYTATFVDVLENPEKRHVLAEMTDWPTLPKVFIGGQFYGDTDILAPMQEKGELEPLLKAAVGQ
ncbi:MAG: glutaredoxin domain-containing protein [Vampirovibrionales bacterium]|nr:glutaredoxin domain-containing protein [Vampirovibrionales bacterium]